MKCAICFEEIFLPYYKSSSCECKIYYHLNCIEKWHKISKTCVICKKKIDNSSLNNVRKIHNKIYELIVFVIIFLIIILSFFVKIMIQYN